jgi:DNA-binding GntR family transcriptional regulator
VRVALAEHPERDEVLSFHVGRVAAPLREQVVDGLREAIVEMRLPPGRRLIERELVEQIGVSRTTIREVLRQLTAEGLVENIPQRGAVVAAVSPEQAEEIYEVRAALEGLAARRFVKYATEEHRAELRRALVEVERVTIDGGDIHAMLKAKDRFYDALLTGSCNETVRSVLSALQARVTALRATSLSRPGRPPHAAAEIRAIVEALEARDADTAAEACAVHLRMASQRRTDA